MKPGRETPRPNGPAVERVPRRAPWDLTRPYVTSAILPWQRGDDARQARDARHAHGASAAALAQAREACNEAPMSVSSSADESLEIEGCSVLPGARARAHHGVAPRARGYRRQGSMSCCGAGGPLRAGGARRGNGARSAGGALAPGWNAPGEARYAAFATPLGDVEARLDRGPPEDRVEVALVACERDPS